VQANPARDRRGARSIRRPSFRLEFLEDRNLLSASALAKPAPVDVQPTIHFVPMQGTVNGVATLGTPALDPQTYNLIVPVSCTGLGNVSHLGRVSLSETHDTVICASTGYSTALMEKGEATLTAASGDQLDLTFTGSSVKTANGFDDTIDYTITGGTGRFARASGSGVIHSTDEAPISPTQIPFVFDLEGVISTVGSSEK
jgi:hypothetical protein